MQQQKINMNPKRFRIGDLAKELKIKKFVIRFWEKEFGLSSTRSGGGQRFYSVEDLQTFSLIKDLLYNQRFTIPGAKQQLQSVLHKKPEQINPAVKIEDDTMEQEINVVAMPQLPQEFWKKLNVLKQKLETLKSALK